MNSESVNHGGESVTMSETTPLHANTTSAHNLTHGDIKLNDQLPNPIARSSRASTITTIDSIATYGSIIEEVPAKATEGDTAKSSLSENYNMTSPEATPAVESNFEDTPGNQSSMPTPVSSNLTAVFTNRIVAALSKQSITNRGPASRAGSLPNIPDMPSSSSASPYQARLLPSNYSRPNNDAQTSVNSNSRTYRQSSNGDDPNCQGNSRPTRTRILTSSAIFLLIVGLVLCASTILFYFFPGQSSKSDDVNDNAKSSFWWGNDDDDMFSDDDKAEAEKNWAKSNNGERGMFDEAGRYIINNYDSLPPFSDFLPGVAGIYGKPVWSFYVNRGQGIASFGVKSKDYPIMEFFSANNAYQNAALLGFRTFYQIHARYGFAGGNNGKSPVIVEPFDPARTRFEELNQQSQPVMRGLGGIPPAQAASQPAAEFANLPIRSMHIGSNELLIREIDHFHKIETNVTYFTLPEEDFGAFVRRTTIANIDSGKTIHLSILDGLARIQPVGGKLNGMLKTIGRTLEGFMGVHAADGKTMPFFRLSTEPADTAAVVVEDAGHYCLSYTEYQEYNLLPIVFDTSKVFGEDTTLLRPIGLFGKTVKEILEEPQYGSAKTSSCFAAVDNVAIYPGESITVTTFYGKADQITDIPLIARRISQGGFAQYKLSRARELIQQITAGVETKTGNKLFDSHVQQMYLDNSLRGGIPVLLGEVDDRSRSEIADDDNRVKVYHLFSRVHGDLERDYNDFVIEPTFFSQGPCNFRDVAQNRRNDVVLNPRIGSFNVKLFLSFIQADGYNPLSVEAVVFTIVDKNECERIAIVAVGHADGHRAQREALANILCDGPFRPGQLANMIEKQNISLLTSLPDLIDVVAASSEVSPMAVSKDGYWADHWTYYMDLINSFLQFFPDREESLMFEEQLPYFFSSRVVLPRSQKYVLSKRYDGKGHHVRQLDASTESKARLKIMENYVNNSSGWFDIEASYQHDENGNIFLSSPIAKLFLLATLKFATRDPYGMGIEYEGGKPGWNDAMNGLVGMVGSGLPETFELKVLLEYILNLVVKYNRPVIVPVELEVLIGSISEALVGLNTSKYMSMSSNVTLGSKVPSELFHYWDAVATAREQYRKNTVEFSGETRKYSPTKLMELIKQFIQQVDLGIERALAIGYDSHPDANSASSRIPPTYFSFNITKWETTGKTNSEGHSFVTAKEVSVGKFPLFLEGAVRMLKTVGKDEGKAIYESVRQSGLHDVKLGMYTLSSSLVGQSYDMGRMMAFPPGWLENQSVWMHMSYKYYLEILRKGLYKEFYKEMLSGMLPFINGTMYGRSPLECSSFIASSAFVDPSMRGRGFLARLSGSTAEFMSIWALMMMGPSPFFINDQTGLLEMQLVPALPFWLFQNESASGQDPPYTIRFKMFTSINVVYYNPEPKDLFGISPRKYEIGLRDGSRIKVKGPTIPTDLARNIRRVVFIDYIHAYF